MKDEGLFHESVLEGMTVDQAAERIRPLLQSEGFGILGDISFDRVLREKTGESISPIRLLEVCNPGFALKAVGVSRDLALMMPCRLTLFESGRGVRLSLFRPTAALSLVGSDASGLANEVEGKLVGVMRRLATGENEVK